jgi:hypothetical protein
MPARAIDLPQERLAIAKIRERSARIEILLLDARGPPCSERKKQQAGLASVPRPGTYW